LIRKALAKQSLEIEIRR